MTVQKCLLTLATHRDPYGYAHARSDDEPLERRNFDDSANLQ